MTINRTGPHRVKLADVSACRQFAPGSLANHESLIIIFVHHKW